HTDIRMAASPHSQETVKSCSSAIVCRYCGTRNGNESKNSMSLCLGYWAGLLHSFCTEISQPGAQIRVAPLECFSHPSWRWFAGQPLQCAIQWRRKVATGASSSLGKTI